MQPFTLRLKRVSEKIENEKISNRTTNEVLSILSIDLLLGYLLEIKRSDERINEFGENQNIKNIQNQIICSLS